MAGAGRGWETHGCRTRVPVHLPLQHCCAVKQHLPSLGLRLQTSFAWGDNSTGIVLSLPLQKLGLYTRQLLLWLGQSLFLILLFLILAGCWNKI